MRTVLVLVLAAVAAAPGCASILRGSTQTIDLAWSPANACATIDGVPARPGSVELARKGSHIVHVEAEGFAPAEVELRSIRSTGWSVLQMASLIPVSLITVGLIFVVGGD